MLKRTERKLDIFILGLSLCVVLLSIVYGVLQGSSPSAVSSAVKPSLETAFKESGAEFLSLSAQCWTKIDSEFHDGQELSYYYEELRGLLGDDDLLSFDEYDDEGYAGFSINGVTEQGYEMNLVVQSLGDRNTEDETYIIVELVDENSIRHLSDMRSYMEKLFGFVSAEAEPSYMIEGAYDEIKSTREKKNIAKKIFRVFNGEIEEKIKEDDYLSYSGYTEQFSYSVNSGDHSVNLQAALSDNEEEGRTHLYLGTPLVFSDF
ncbi:MAG: YwmB family TATA-box binding protein [Clostridia bacterium]